MKMPIKGTLISRINYVTRNMIIMERTKKNTKPVTKTSRSTISLHTINLLQIFSDLLRLTMTCTKARSCWRYQLIPTLLPRKLKRIDNLTRVIIENNRHLWIRMQQACQGTRAWNFYKNIALRKS